MAQKDLEFQLERIRERLMDLNKEAHTYSEHANIKYRPNLFIILLFVVTLILCPVKNEVEVLGPFISNISAELTFLNNDTGYREKSKVHQEFSDDSQVQLSTEELTPLDVPNAPEMRYASSQLIFVTPPKRINLAPKMEKIPVVDRLAFHFPGNNKKKPSQVKVTSENMVVEIDDLYEEIIAVVHKSEQKLHLFKNGHKKYSWEVSTARAGKVTPTGTWNAQWLSKHHKSSRYNNAPMPYSIFYDGNFAIHGTDQIHKLGTPASSGCVRLHPENAAVLFAMVRQVGKSNFAVRVIE